MAKNYIQEGNRLELTAPGGGVVSGTPVVIGGFFCVPLVTAAAGAKFAAALTGVWTLPKTTGTAWNEGDRIYWNAGTSKLSTVGADGIFVGCAASAALSADAVGNVRLSGPMSNLEGAQPAIGAFVAPTDSPATADALRDDLTANWLPKLNAIVTALQTAGVTL